MLAWEDSSTSLTCCTFLDLVAPLLSTETKAATVHWPGRAVDLLELGLSRFLAIFRHLMKLGKQAMLLWLVQLFPMLQRAGPRAVGRLCSACLHRLWGGRGPERLVLENWERLEPSASALGFPSVLSHHALRSNDILFNSPNVWGE